MTAENSSMQSKALKFGAYSWSLSAPPSRSSSSSSSSISSNSKEKERPEGNPSDAAEPVVSTDIPSRAPLDSGTLASTAVVDTRVGVVTYDTATFRRLTNLLHPQDMVIEIGCSYGKATTLISEAVGRNSSQVLGIDTSKDVLQQAIKAYPHLTNSFVQCDVVATPFIAYEIIDKFLRGVSGGERSVRATKTSQVVVFMDIGGNRELETNLALLSWIISDMPQHPRLIVIKSQSLYCAVAGHYENNIFPLDCHVHAKFDWADLMEQGRLNVLNRKRRRGSATDKDKDKDGAEDTNKGVGEDRDVSGAKAGTQASSVLVPLLPAAAAAGGGGAVRSKMPYPMKAPRRQTSDGVDICRYAGMR